MRRNTSGFTLIELLVVIAIIGLLATVILASLQTPRAKSRDAARLADLKEMAKAINLADGDPAVALQGCVGGGTSAAPGANNNASVCTGPSPINFAKYTDTAAPSTLCTKTSSAACQYIIAQQNGASGNPTTQNWEICTYLENGTSQLGGGSASIHMVRIDSQSGGTVVLNCN